MSDMLDKMTLRDYFAAKAMQAMEARNASGTNYSRAIHAYEIADAMLEARNIKEKENGN